MPKLEGPSEKEKDVALKREKSKDGNIGDMTALLGEDDPTLVESTLTKTGLAQAVVNLEARVKALEEQL